METASTTQPETVFGCSTCGVFSYVLVHCSDGGRRCVECWAKWWRLRRARFWDDSRAKHISLAYGQAGRVAYGAYVKQAGGVSLVSGVTLPTWENLPDSIQTAWAYAARAVLEANPRI